MTLQIRPASRTSVKSLIGLYGESGSGKTMSALLLARGIAGPSGRITLIDTESGRGELYADVIPGGYSVLTLGEPYTPARYIEAITLAEQSCDVLVIDSASHEWEGIGGVLDLAGDNEQAGKKGLAIWKSPKMEHAKMVLKLLQSKVPVIVCLRAKYKSRQVKNARGFSEIVKDDKLTPIQADDFIFEMTAHAEIQQDHTIRLTKCSHPALKDCFPEDLKAPLTVANGEAIARWATGGAAPALSATRAPAASPGTGALKKELWNLAKGRFGDPKEFEQWLWDEGLISDTENLADQTREGFERLIRIVPGKLEPKQS